MAAPSPWPRRLLAPAIVGYMLALSAAIDLAGPLVAWAVGAVGALLFAMLAHRAGQSDH